MLFCQWKYTQCKYRTRVGILKSNYRISLNRQSMLLNKLIVHFINNFEKLEKTFKISKQRAFKYTKSILKPLRLSLYTKTLIANFDGQCFNFIN